MANPIDISALTNSLAALGENNRILFEHNERKKERNRARRERDKAAARGTQGQISQLGSIAGGIVGTIYGGPGAGTAMGAAAGGAIGNVVGGAITGQGPDTGQLAQTGINAATQYAANQASTAAQNAYADASQSSERTALSGNLDNAYNFGSQFNDVSSLGYGPTPVPQQYGPLNEAGSPAPQQPAPYLQQPDFNVMNQQVQPSPQPQQIAPGGQFTEGLMSGVRGYDRDPTTGQLIPSTAATSVDPRTGAVSALGSGRSMVSPANAELERTQPQRNLVESVALRQQPRLDALEARRDLTIAQQKELEKKDKELRKEAFEREKFNQTALSDSNKAPTYDLISKATGDVIRSGQTRSEINELRSEEPELYSGAIIRKTATSSGSSSSELTKTQKLAEEGAIKRSILENGQRGSTGNQSKISTLLNLDDAALGSIPIASIETVAGIKPEKEIQTWVPESRGGIAGQRNTLTQKWEPQTGQAALTGSGRVNFAKSIYNQYVSGPVPESISLQGTTAQIEKRVEQAGQRKLGNIVRANLNKRLSKINPKNYMEQAAALDEAAADLANRGGNFNDDYVRELSASSDDKKKRFSELQKNAYARGIQKFARNPDNPTETERMMAKLATDQEVAATAGLVSGAKVTASKKAEYALAAERPLTLKERENYKEKFNISLEPGTKVGDLGKTPEFKKPKVVTAKMINDAAQASVAEGSAKELMRLYDPSYTGPLNQIGTYAAIATGKSRDGFNMVDIDPKLARFYNMSNQLKNMVIKAITGAQMSEGEAERIMAQLPTIKNPSAVWIQNMSSTMENLRNIQNTILEGAAAGDKRFVIDNAKFSTMTDDDQKSVDLRLLSPGARKAWKFKSESVWNANNNGVQ